MLGGVALRDVFFNFCHNRLWIFYAKPDFCEKKMTLEDVPKIIRNAIAPSHDLV